MWLPAVHLQPGLVAVRSAPASGAFVIGRYPQGSDGIARAVARDLTESGFGAHTSENVMRWKYSKLLRNLINALDAIVTPEHDSSEVLQAATAEAQRVLEAAGIDVASAAEEEQLRSSIDLSREVPGLVEAGSSSWQSLVKGSRSVEVDYLNGEIVLLGRRHSIQTPVNSALQRIVNGFARNGVIPRSWSIDQVREIINEEIHRAA